MWPMRQKVKIKCVERDKTEFTDGLVILVNQRETSGYPSLLPC